MAAGDTTVKSIVDSILKCLECPICLDFLQDPVTTGCNHRFCKNCIVTALKKKYTIACPLCKSKVTKRQLQEKAHLSEIVKIAKRLAETVEEDLFEKTISKVCSLSSDISSANGEKDNSEHSVKSSSTTKRKRQRQQSTEMPSNKTSKVEGDETNNKKVQKKQVFVHPDNELQVKVKVSTNTNIQSGFPARQRKRKPDSSSSIDKYFIRTDDIKEQKVTEKRKTQYPLISPSCQNVHKHNEKTVHTKNKEYNLNVTLERCDSNVEQNRKAARTKNDSPDTSLLETQAKKIYTRSGRMVKRSIDETKFCNSKRIEDNAKVNTKVIEVIDITDTEGEIPTAVKEAVVKQHSKDNNQSRSSESPAIDILSLKQNMPGTIDYNDKEPSIKHPETLTLDPYEFIPSQHTPKAAKKKRQSERTKTVKRIVLPNLISVENKTNSSSFSLRAEAFTSSIDDFVSMERKAPHVESKTNEKLIDNDQQDNEHVLFATPAVDVLELNAQNNFVWEKPFDTNKVVSKSSKTRKSTPRKRFRKSRDKPEFDSSTQEEISNWFDEIKSAENYTLNINGVQDKEQNNLLKSKMCMSNNEDLSDEEDDKVSKHDEVLIAKDCFDDNVLSDSSEDVLCNDNNQSEECNEETCTLTEKYKFRDSHEATDEQNYCNDDKKIKPPLNSCTSKSVDSQDTQYEVLTSENCMIESCDKAANSHNFIEDDNISAGNEKVKNNTQSASVAFELHNDTEMNETEEMIPNLVNSKYEMKGKAITENIQLSLPNGEVISASTPLLQANAIQKNNGSTYDVSLNSYREDNLDDSIKLTYTVDDQRHKSNDLLCERSQGEDQQSTADQSKDGMALKPQSMDMQEAKPESSLGCSRVLFSECVNDEDSVPVSAFPKTPHLTKKNDLQLDETMSLANENPVNETANMHNQHTSMHINKSSKSPQVATDSLNKNQVFSSCSEDEFDEADNKTEFKKPKRKTFSLDVESQELKEFVLSNQHNTLDLLNEICMEFESSRNKQCNAEDLATQLENKEKDISCTDEVLGITEERCHESHFKNPKVPSQRVKSQDELKSSNDDSCDIPCGQKEFSGVKSSEKDSYEIPCGQKEHSTQKVSTNQTSAEGPSQDFCICSGSCCCKLQSSLKSKDNFLETKSTKNNLQINTNNFQNDTPPSSDCENVSNFPVRYLEGRKKATKQIALQCPVTIAIPLSTINDNYDDKNVRKKIIAQTPCPCCEYDVQLERTNGDLVLRFVTGKANSTHQEEMIEQDTYDKVCLIENIGDDKAVVGKTNEEGGDKHSNNSDLNAIIVTSTGASEENSSSDCEIADGIMPEKSIGEPILLQEDAIQKIRECTCDDTLDLHTNIDQNNVKEDNLENSIKLTYNVDDQKHKSKDLLCQNSQAEDQPQVVSVNESENLLASLSEMVPGTVFTEPQEALCESDKTAKTKETTATEIDVERKETDANCHELNPSPVPAIIVQDESENFDVDSLKAKKRGKNITTDNTGMSNRIRHLEQESDIEMSEEIDPFLFRHNIPLNNSVEKHNIEQVLKEMSASSSDPDMIFAESLVAPLKTYQKTNKEKQNKNKNTTVDCDKNTQQISNSDKNKALMETLASCIPSSPESCIPRKRPLHPSKTVNSQQTNRGIKENALPGTLKRSSTEVTSPVLFKQKKRNFQRIRTFSDSDESSDELVNVSLANTPKQGQRRRVTRSLQNSHHYMDDMENWKGKGQFMDGVKSNEKKFSSTQMSHIIDLSEMGSSEEFHPTEAQEKIRLEIEQMKAQIRQMEIQLQRTESLNTPFSKRKEKDHSLYDSDEESDDLFSPIPPTPPTSAQKEEKHRSMSHLR